MTECLIRSGVHLWEVLKRSVCVLLEPQLSVHLEMFTYEKIKVVFVCGWEVLWLSVHIRGLSSFGMLKIQCLCVAWTMTECPLRRDVCLWEVENVVFVYDW